MVETRVACTKKAGCTFDENKTTGNKRSDEKCPHDAVRRRITMEGEALALHQSFRHICAQTYSLWVPIYSYSDAHTGLPRTSCLDKAASERLFRRASFLRVGGHWCSECFGKQKTTVVQRSGQKSHKKTKE